jgi:hypothetical protein
MLNVLPISHPIGSKALAGQSAASLSPDTSTPKQSPMSFSVGLKCLQSLHFGKLFTSFNFFEKVFIFL